MSKYMSCADTAKLVRKALGEAFPGVKFSTRSKTYSGGASITVHWIDGPNAKQVEAVAGTFSGAVFDGMIDYKESTYALVNGERVHFGADFIFCTREYSDAAIERAITAVFREYAGNLRAIASPAVAAFRRGELYSVAVDGLPRNIDNLQSLINVRLSKVSDRLAPAAAPTAAKVIYLGGAGYSEMSRLNPELAT